MRLACLVCFLVVSFSCFAGDFPCGDPYFPIATLIKRLEKLKKDNIEALEYGGLFSVLERRKNFQGEIDYMYAYAYKKSFPEIVQFLGDFVSEKILEDLPMDKLFDEDFLNKKAAEKKWRRLNGDLNGYIITFWKKKGNDLACATNTICSKIFAIKDAVLNNVSLEDFTASFFSTKEIKKNLFLREYLKGLCPFISNKWIKAFVECKLKKFPSHDSSSDSPCSPVSPIVLMLTMCKGQKINSNELRCNLNTLGAIENNDYEKRFGHSSRILISPKRRKNIKKARCGKIGVAHLDFEGCVKERKKAICLGACGEFRSSMFD